MQRDAALHSENRTTTDYIIAGDIISISSQYLLYTPHILKTFLQLIPVGLDLPPLFLKTPPYVMVLGMVITTNEDKSYIKLEPKQFVSLL